MEYSVKLPISTAFTAILKITQPQCNAIGVRTLPVEDFPVINLVIVALNHSGSYGNHFFNVLEKSKNVIDQHRSVRIGKTCALCLKYRPRPTASGGIQDLGYSFSQYGPPAGQ